MEVAILLLETTITILLPDSDIAIGRTVLLPVPARDTTLVTGFLLIIVKIFWIWSSIKLYSFLLSEIKLLLDDDTLDNWSILVILIYKNFIKDY